MAAIIDRNVSGSAFMHQDYKGGRQCRCEV